VDSRPRYPVYDQCVGAIRGFPLGYPPPIISTILEALNKRSLGPSLPPTNNLKGCDTYKELVGSKVSHSYTVDDPRLQIQFRFDPTKHFRATENPIKTPDFSQQPMLTRKKSTW